MLSAVATPFIFSCGYLLILIHLWKHSSIDALACKLAYAIKAGRAVWEYSCCDSHIKQRMTEMRSSFLLNMIAVCQHLVCLTAVACIWVCDYSFDTASIDKDYTGFLIVLASLCLVYMLCSCILAGYVDANVGADLLFAMITMGMSVRALHVYRSGDAQLFASMSQLRTMIRLATSVMYMDVRKSTFGNLLFTAVCCYGNIVYPLQMSSPLSERLRKCIADLTSWIMLVIVSAFLELCCARMVWAMMSSSAGLGTTPKSVDTYEADEVGSADESTDGAERLQVQKTDTAKCGNVGTRDEDEADSTGDSVDGSKKSQVQGISLPSCEKENMATLEQHSHHPLSSHTTALEGDSVAAQSAVAEGGVPVIKEPESDSTCQESRQSLKHGELRSLRSHEVRASMPKPRKRGSRISSSSSCSSSHSDKASTHEILHCEGVANIRFLVEAGTMDVMGFFYQFQKKCRPPNLHHLIEPSQIGKLTTWIQHGIHRLSYDWDAKWPDFESPLIFHVPSLSGQRQADKYVARKVHLEVVNADELVVSINSNHVSRVVLLDRKYCSSRSVLPPVVED